MSARIETVTAIAMVGAWDATRNSNQLVTRSGKTFEQTLESDARAGQLFLIHTGGEGGGPIDVFLDQEIPESLRNWIRPMPSEFLLRVPSGQLVVGGVEDYRFDKPQITGPDSVTLIPPGDYMVKCYVGDEETIFLKRNKRYQRVDKLINKAQFKARAKDSPIFVFQLRKTEYMPGLEGGSLYIGFI